MDPTPIIVFSAYAIYGALLYSFGGAHGRERAYAVWHSAFISAALYATAVAMGYVLGALIQYYVSISGVTPRCLSYFQPAGLEQVYNAASQATRCAADVFQRHFNAIAESYGWIFGVSTVTGILVVLSAYSMGLFQAAMPFSAVATSALVALGAATAATQLTLGFALLLPIGAILVTYERTRPIGALLLGAGIAFPAVLAGGADVLAQTPTTYIWFWKYLLLGELVKEAGHVAYIAAVTTMTLLLASAATYAISRIYDHAGAHLSVE
mgnify:CR=1 FL=1